MSQTQHTDPGGLRDGGGAMVARTTSGADTDPGGGVEDTDDVLGCFAALEERESQGGGFKE